MAEVIRTVRAPTVRALGMRNPEALGAASSPPVNAAIDVVQGTQLGVGIGNVAVGLGHCLAYGTHDLAHPLGGSLIVHGVGLALVVLGNLEKLVALHDGGQVGLIDHTVVGLDEVDAVQAQHTVNVQHQEALYLGVSAKGLQLADLLCIIVQKSNYITDSLNVLENKVPGALYHRRHGGTFRLSCICSGLRHVKQSAGGRVVSHDVGQQLVVAVGGDGVVMPSNTSRNTSEVFVAHLGKPPQAH
ncbi:uncharacterized protein BcabD6B2_35180 [Babesia caballi]|uniref:Uncharacterized protein n=1 Tax=Babesia caballi TaxID=5871 RepID=A0AAV4LWE9_BABCB|nr:hypothetical protein BcabD6B2_35180 [Babesia caballi]